MKRLINLADDNEAYNLMNIAINYYFIIFNCIFVDLKQPVPHNIITVAQ